MDQSALGEAPVASFAPLLFENVSVFDGEKLLPPTNVVVDLATSDAEAGGNSEAIVEVVQGGANDSAYSLQVTGTVSEKFLHPWSGTMFMAGAQPFGPADLARRPQLTFWAKGDEGTYRVQIHCQNTGPYPPEHHFDLTKDWAEVTIDLHTLGGCNLAGLVAVIFSAFEPGEFKFQLDDVRFGPT